MALFDRTRLLASANRFFQSPNQTTRQTFLVEAHTYCTYLARSAVRKCRGQGLGDYSELTNDASGYALQHLIAYLAGPKFRVSDWASDPLAFVTKYLKSRLADYLRAEQRRTARLIKGSTIDCKDPIESVPSGQADMAQILHAEAVATSLALAVKQLPSSLQVVYQLRFGESVPPREISKTLGVPVATVYQYVAQIKQYVRNQVDRKRVA